MNTCNDYGSSPPVIIPVSLAAADIVYVSRPWWLWVHSTVFWRLKCIPNYFLVKIIVQILEIYIIDIYRKEIYVYLFSAVYYGTFNFFLALWSLKS